MSRNLFGDEKKQKYITLSVMLLLAVGLAIFAIRPLVVRVSTNSKYAKEAKIINEQLNQNLADLETIRQLHADYQEEIKLIDQSIPSEPNEGEFIQMFQELTYKYNLNIANTNFSYSKNTLTYKIGVEGRYDQFTEFIDELTKLIRITAIDSIDIRAPKTFAPGVIRADIDGRAFYTSKNGNGKDNEEESQTLLQEEVSRQ